MALQGGAPITIAGQGAVPVWNPGQPAPPGYHVSPDGQSLISDATGQVVVSKPAVSGNVTNAQNPNSNNLGDKLFNNNPLGGTFNAANDLAHGNFQKAGGDFIQGATYGTIPVGGNAIPTAETAVSKLPGAASDAGSKVAAGATNLMNDIGGALGAAPPVDVSKLGTIADTSLASQQELDALRRNAEANPTAAPQTGLVQIDQTNIDPLRQRQGIALDALTAAANGTAPSAAELAGKAAADRAAAQAYGAAAALQGGNSSGGTLRQALDAQTQLQGDANTQMLINRANEQATARQQLVQGIGNAQQQEGNLATTNANLTQQGNLANQSADINTRSQDINREENLVSGANTATANATAAQKAATDAQVQQQANADAMKGALISGGAGIVGKIISDEREKTGIRRADLVQLADDAPGYTFEYRDQRNGPGERVGVMAQDVARARLGKRLVQLGPDGDLELDGANAVGAALAMSAQALREARAARGR